jgi:8-oxo-dGTP pyrophosphatase MutT (NUDIX family)
MGFFEATGAYKGETIVNTLCLRTIMDAAAHPGPPEDGRYQSTSVFLLVFDKVNPHVLAIQKADTEGYPWRNQVALPGGHIDPEDISAMDAGFRELKEELDISRDHVDYVGSLGHFQTINHKDIQVFVGLWDGNGIIRHNTHEISRTLKIPLETLVNIHTAQGYHGRTPDVFTLLYPYQDVTIWGVTAKILHHFIEVIYPHLSGVICRSAAHSD